MKAAEQGNVIAQNNVGYMYETGQGIAKDREKALEWYQKAAAQGDGEAKKKARKLSK